MIRLDQLNNRTKTIIIILVVIPLFGLIFYDMMSNMQESNTSYYLCQGELITMNETKKYYCENTIIKYDASEGRMYILTMQHNRFDESIDFRINESLYSPD